MNKESRESSDAEERCSEEDGPLWSWCLTSEARWRGKIVVVVELDGS